MTRSLRRKYHGGNMPTLSTTGTDALFPPGFTNNSVRRNQLSGLIVAVCSLVILALLATPRPVRAQEEIPEMPVGDFRLVLTEAFLVEQLETQIAPFIDELSVYGFTISDPEINLRDGNRIDVSVTTDLPLGNQTLTVRPTVTVAVAAADNEMSFTIEGISMEGLALPASLSGSQLEEVQTQGQEQINKLLATISRLGGIEMVYIGTTDDLLILDFNFDLKFYELNQ